jgi:hypothetical protein
VGFGFVPGARQAAVILPSAGNEKPDGITPLNLTVSAFPTEARLKGLTHPAIILYSLLGGNGSMSAALLAGRTKPSRGDTRKPDTPKFVDRHKVRRRWRGLCLPGCPTL